MVDGLKNSGRKVIHTVYTDNITKDLKVLQLASKAAERTQYLHGDLSGSIVNLAQHHIGSNNMPLLKDSGEFGGRFEPVAAAPRYIFTHKETVFDTIFIKDDYPVLKHQTFEGDSIEPMFYMPTLPMLLVNGSEGIASGYAQKILPRKISDIKRNIKRVLDGSNPHKMKPHYEGFKGTIRSGDGKGKWEIVGAIKDPVRNTVEITEIPIGYTLNSYLKVLDTLEEKKVLRSYVDMSDDDQFSFKVTFGTGVLKDMDQEAILEKLKLIKKVSENYTVIDESNMIKVFDAPEDILKEWVEIKLYYTTLRKEHMMKEMAQAGALMTSKFIFIKGVVDGKIVVTNTKKDDIIKQIDGVKGIIERDGSYDYLLNMPIHSLSKEKVTALKQQISTLMGEMEALKDTEVNDIFMGDLEKVK